mgnify:FL=1
MFLSCSLLSAASPGSPPAKKQHAHLLDVQDQRVLQTTFTALSTIRLQQHLAQVFGILSILSQDGVIPPVTVLIQQLLHKRVFEHRKPEVRIMVGAVLAEIFRLTIEKPVFNRAAILKCFALFERILIGLNDVSASTFDAGYKVIEEVVMCGSVALLVEVCCSEETTTMVGGDDDDDDRQPLDLSSTAVSDQQLEPLLSFMSSVVHVMTDQHDKQFSSLMLEVAIFTLEELDAAGGIPQSVMDIIVTGTSSSSSCGVWVLFFCCLDVLPPFVSPGFSCVCGPLNRVFVCVVFSSVDPLSWRARWQN